MKLIKKIAAGIVLLFVAGTLGLIVWGNGAYPPHPPALDALVSDAQVEVTQGDAFITFEPVGVQPRTGFVFVPGGRVDYRVYSPALRLIAAKGYFVSVVKVRINLAFFDINAPARVISQYPDIQNWVVGGHSLGGVAAASYTADHLGEVDGLVLWASYPGDQRLKDTAIKALTLYGSEDMEGDTQTELSSSRLPSSAQFFVIEGGNHAQFGAYGPQAGDRPATITAEEQWIQAAAYTVSFLELISQ